MFRTGDWARYQPEISARLREEISRFVGVRHVRSVCSGSAALELALRACGLGGASPRGRAGQGGAELPEVICPIFDFPATVRAVRLLGGLPVLVDTEPGGWTIDPEAVADAATERTVAVVASHLYGRPAAVDRLRTLCDGRGWMLIEDVCQMPGGRIGGRPLGSFGHIAAWSFGGSKPLTSGCGGAITTDDDRLIQRLAAFIDRPGDTFPLSPLQCAVLLPQWRGLDAFASGQRESAERLVTLCAGRTANWRLPQPDLHRAGVFYKVPMVLQAAESESAAEELRQRIIAAAVAAGIPAGEAFRPVEKMAPSRGRIHSRSHADAIAARTWLLDHRVLLGDLAALSDALAAIHDSASGGFTDPLPHPGPRG